MNTYSLTDTATPPVPPRRDCYLHIRVTRSEKAAIEALANKLDVQLSHLVRHVLLQFVHDLEEAL